MYTEKDRIYRKRSHLKHKQADNERSKQWRLEHPDKVREYNQSNREYKSQWNREHKERLIEIIKQWDKDHPERRNLYVRTQRLKRKYRLMFILCGGEPKCKLCPATEFGLLTLDHINGDGWYDRKVKKLIFGTEMVRYYLNNIELAKKKLQVLCYPCHKVKRQVNGDRLPDKTKVVDENQLTLFH